MDQAIGVLRKRLDTLGTREISIQPEGSNRIKIQIPGLQGDEVEQTEKLLSQVALLQFQLVPENEDEILDAAKAHAVNGVPTLPYQYALDYEVLPSIHKDAQGNDVKSWIVVEKKVQMSGKYVSHAYRSLDQTGNSVVDIEFNDEGKALFGQSPTYAQTQDRPGGSSPSCSTAW